MDEHLVEPVEDHHGALALDLLDDLGRGRRRFAATGLPGALEQVVEDRLECRLLMLDVAEPAQVEVDRQARRAVAAAPAGEQPAREDLRRGRLAHPVLAEDHEIRGGAGVVGPLAQVVLDVDRRVERLAVGWAAIELRAQRARLDGRPAVGGHEARPVPTHSR